MFSAYLVFARRQIHFADGVHGAQRAEEIHLIDSFLPPPTNEKDLAQMDLSLDERLRQLSFPKASVLGEFCFPRKRAPDDANGLVAPSTYFTFCLTQPNGERVHAFCLRGFRPSLDLSNRLDVGTDWIECSVILTKHYLPRLFPAALKICRVRRYLDRTSCFDFLSQLHLARPTDSSNGNGSGGRLLVESSSLNISCKYEFSTAANTPAQLDVLFDTTTSQMLHYVMGALLLERRVLFVAKNEQRLSDTMYAFDSLLVQMNAPISLGYPHNFVPVLPGSMMEQGVGNPTPYMVGMLKVYLKAMDNLKDVGDIVIVDLDNRQIRLSPGSAGLIPLGVDTVERKPPAAASSSSSSAAAASGEEINPWADVTSHFCRDVAQAYQNRDVDLLACTVRALLLVLVGPGRLEDLSLRSFHAHYSTTSIFKVHQANLRANGFLTHMLQQSRGFPVFRQAYMQVNANQYSPERQSVNNVKQAVLELTGAAKEAVNAVNKSTTEIAKRTFDAFAFTAGVYPGLQQRYSDIAARNWKLIFKALGLTTFLVRTGSELCVAECWDDLKQIFDFTRYSVQGVVGIPSKVAELVQKRAQDLYSLVVDMDALAFARSMAGHVMVQRSVRLKMQASAKRLPGNYRADLAGLLAFTCPDPSLMDVAKERNHGEAMSQQQHQPQPPPPEPLLDFSDFVSAPPPPPPPAAMAIAANSSPPPLLDFYDGDAPAAAAAAASKQQQPRARRPYSAEDPAPDAAASWSEPSSIPAAAAATVPVRPARPPAPALLPPTSTSTSNQDGLTPIQPRVRGPPPPGIHARPDSPPQYQ